MAHVRLTHADVGTTITKETHFDRDRFNELLAEIERRGYSVKNFDARVAYREGYSDFPRITFEIVQLPKEEKID